MLRQVAPKDAPLHGKSLARTPVDAGPLIVTAGFLVFAFLVVRTAWLCDDAFITFRTLDNLVNGYGLRWNVAERVQSFTHPLWLMLLAGFYAVTRDAYFTPLAISMCLAFGAVWLFLTRIASSLATMLVGLATFVFSRAFVEYSTSGLENPLTTFLLAAFLAVYWAGSTRRSMWLWVVAGLLMLNRLDVGLLVLPMLGADAWRTPWRTTVRNAAVGLSPLLAWEIFSIIYYGFPMPNTAYAKLQTGVATRALVGQGLLYFVDSIAQDPVTLLMMATAALVVLREDARTSWPVVAGIGLYLAYIVRAGGDFMSGRFLVAPLFCAVAAAAHLRWASTPAGVGWVVTALALLGWTATTHPPIASGTNSYPDGETFGVSGVADERSFDYPNTGLLHWSREHPLPAGVWVKGGLAVRGTSSVVVRANIGLYGYFAGPSVHIVDAYGLGDPLIARLPACVPWRIGHFERRVPEGYLESIRTGTNRIADLQVAALYGQLKLITQGPIWSHQRWRAIRRLNVGW